MEGLSAYSSPVNVGHKLLEGFFDGNAIVVQEKIDGSQFSFGVHNGQLHMRSRKNAVYPDQGGMFGPAIKTVTDLFSLDQLAKEYTYRGEAVTTPHHNILTYDHTPPGGIILFDIDRGVCDYMSPEELEAESARIGLMCVPHIATITEKPTISKLDEWVNQESVLGGVDREGVVLKNYRVFGPDAKVVMAKYVRPAFKEQHNKDWKQANPGQNDIVTRVVEEFGSEARFAKAIQHLREDGKLVGEMRDMPTLVAEFERDFWEESSTEVADMLLAYFKKQITRGVMRGLPEYYKAYLAKQMFGEE